MPRLPAVRLFAYTQREFRKIGAAALSWLQWYLFVNASPAACVDSFGYRLRHVEQIHTEYDPSFIRNVYFHRFALNPFALRYFAQR